MAVMRLTVVLLAASSLLVGCAIARPYGEGVSLHTMLSAGYRGVEDSELDGHPTYALELATREAEQGWGYEAGASYGAESESGPREPEREVNEYSLGLRRSWMTDGGARPYFGFGGAFTSVEHRLHDPRAEFEDEGGGAYAHGGVLWHLGTFDFDRGTEVLIGFDVRGLVGDDYDYAQLALVLGFGR